MKSETIIRNFTIFRRTLSLLISITLFFSAASLFSQEESTPEVKIQLNKKLDYERPARLKEEDSRDGDIFKFESGLEIVTDIEYVKVYLFDEAAGRTPFESDDISNGYVRVKLEKPGYSDFSFWVNIKEGYRTTAYVYYKDKPVEVNNNPVPQPTDLDVFDSQPVYLFFNPGDPAYYRQLYIMNDEDSDSHYSAFLKNKDSEKEISLIPEESKYPFVFTWDGKDALGEEQEEGKYSLHFDPGEEYEVELSRMYSRKPVNYYTGTAGLLLAPTAQILFPGGFQFGSIFSVENNGDYSLPFSFFVRFSPLKRWEASFETEVAFINESGEPSLRLNSSQKVYIFGNDFFQLSLGLRGSYKGAINDLEQNVQNSLIRDPSGFSFFIPMQFDLKNWDFIFTPEYLYTLPVAESSDALDNNDSSAVLRWGVNYSSSIFGAAFSSALFLPSYNGSRMVMQVGVEGAMYIPGTPMYVNLFVLEQRIRDGQEGVSAGMNLGFLF